MTEAYVAPVVIEGQLTPEEKIAEKKKELARLTNAIKKEKDDTARKTLEASQIQVASEL